MNPRGVPKPEIFRDTQGIGQETEPSDELIRAQKSRDTPGFLNTLRGKRL
jgi:hypothetical protein